MQVWARALLPLAPGAVNLAAVCAARARLQFEPADALSPPIATPFTTPGFELRAQAE